MSWLDEVSSKVNATLQTVSDYIDSYQTAESQFNAAKDKILESVGLTSSAGQGGGTEVIENDKVTGSNENMLIILAIGIGIFLLVK